MKTKHMVNIFETTTKGKRIEVSVCYWRMFTGRGFYLDATVAEDHAVEGLVIHSVGRSSHLLLETNDRFNAKTLTKYAVAAPSMVVYRNLVMKVAQDNGLTLASPL